MTNADGVLDQIDHALHDWDTSGDAMRWTPEPAPVVDPTVIDVTASMMRLGEVMRDAQDKLARVFMNMAKQVAKLQVQIWELTAAREESEAQIRRSAMRRAYHHRQKRRRS